MKVSGMNSCSSSLLILTAGERALVTPVPQVLIMNSLQRCKSNRAKELHRGPYTELSCIFTFSWCFLSSSWMTFRGTHSLNLHFRKLCVFGHQRWSSGGCQDSAAGLHRAGRWWKQRRSVAVAPLTFLSPRLKTEHLWAGVYSLCPQRCQPSCPGSPTLWASSFLAVPMWSLEASSWTPTALSFLICTWMYWMWNLKGLLHSTACSYERISSPGCQHPPEKLLSVSAEHVQIQPS